MHVFLSMSEGMRMCESRCACTCMGIYIAGDRQSGQNTPRHVGKYVSKSQCCVLPRFFSSASLVMCLPALTFNTKSSGLGVSASIEASPRWIPSTSTGVRRYVSDAVGEAHVSKQGKWESVIGKGGG